MVENSDNLSTSPLGRFFVSGQSRKTSHPGVRLHPSASAGIFIQLRCLSSGTSLQGVREHFVRGPSPGGSAGCHRGSALPKALRQSLTPSCSWLQERHSKGFV